MARVWPIAAEGGRNWLAIFTAGSELRRWDTDRATVDGLFSQAPIGLAVFDPHLCFIRINDALQKIHGIPREEALGRRITALFPGPEAEQMEERIRQVLETGEPVTKEHRAPTPTLQGWNRDWSITSFRLCDPAYKVLGVASAVVEVTERNRARDRLVLLNDASERIGTTLDVTRTAAELTEVAVPRLADFIAVDLLEGIALGEESVPGPVGGDAVLRRAAIRSVHEDAPEASYAPGALITFHAATPQAQAMATGEAVLLPTLEGTADWLTHDLHRAGKMTEAGVHSVMVVPLCARDVTLGVAHFYRWRRPDPSRPTTWLPRVRWWPAPRSAWTTPAASPTSGMPRSPSSRACSTSPRPNSARSPPPTATCLPAAGGSRRRLVRHHSALRGAGRPDRRRRPGARRPRRGRGGSAAHRGPRSGTAGSRP